MWTLLGLSVCIVDFMRSFCVYVNSMMIFCVHEDFMRTFCIGMLSVYDFLTESVVSPV